MCMRARRTSYLHLAGVRSSESCLLLLLPRLLYTSALPQPRMRASPAKSQQQPTRSAADRHANCHQFRGRNFPPKAALVREDKNDWEYRCMRERARDCRSTIFLRRPRIVVPFFPRSAARVRMDGKRCAGGFGSDRALAPNANGVRCGGRIRSGGSCDEQFLRVWPRVVFRRKTDDLDFGVEFDFVW